MNTSNQNLDLRGLSRATSRKVNIPIRKENSMEKSLIKHSANNTKDVFKRTKDVLDKKVSLQNKLDGYILDQPKTFQALSRRIEILLPSPLGYLLEKQFLATNSKKRESSTLSLETAKLNLITKLILTKHKDTNKWLVNLTTVMEQFKSSDSRYIKVVEEIQKRVHRRILLLNLCLFGSLSLIINRCITNKKVAKTVDLQTLLNLLWVLNDLNCFTTAQKKCLITQYQKYCRLNDLRPNELFLAIAQKTKRDYYPEEQLELINCSDRFELDIDDAAVDDDCVEILLTDEWYANFEIEMDLMKDQILGKVIDRKICIENSFFNKVSNTGLSEREACIMCRKERCAVLFIPCTHFLVCQDCSNLLDQCLSCKKEVDEGILIYWS